MKNLFTVMEFTIKEAVKRKSFVITNIILILAIVLIFNIPNIADKFFKDNENKEIIFVDEEGIIAQSGINEIEEYKIVIDNNTSLEELARKVEEDEASGIVKIKNENGALSFDYIVKNYGSGLNPAVVQAFVKQLNDVNLLIKANVPQDTILALNTPIEYEIKKSSDINSDVKGSNGMTILASLILFMAIYYFAYSVCLTISSEKSSRAMETLITSTKPSTIVLGKTIGMGIVGLLQIAVLIAVAVFSYNTFLPKETTFLDGFIDFSNINAQTIALMVVYFVLGYLLYAMMYAVVGSSISRQEELQSASTPVALITVISFYAGYFSTILSPGGKMAVISSIVPFSSPFTMLSRMMSEQVPTSEIAFSILALIVAIMVISWISIKIYSSAVLHYGNKLSLKDLGKMLLSK